MVRIVDDMDREATRHSDQVFCLLGFFPFPVKTIIPKENFSFWSDQENKDNLNTKEMVRPSSSPTAVRTGTWKTFSWEPNRSGRYDPRSMIPCKTVFAMPIAPS